MIEILALAALTTIEPLDRLWCAATIDAMAAEILLKRGDEPIGVGTFFDGYSIVMFVNEATATFAYVEVEPDGTSCVIGSGGGWISLPRPAPAGDAELVP